MTMHPYSSICFACGLAICFATANVSLAGPQRSEAVETPEHTRLDGRFRNFIMEGTYEESSPQSDPLNRKRFPVRFYRNGCDYRVSRQLTGDECQGKSGWKHFVTSDDISFVAERANDGTERIDILSPRRGADRARVRSAVLEIISTATAMDSITGIAANELILWDQRPSDSDAGGCAFPVEGHVPGDAGGNEIAVSGTAFVDSELRAIRSAEVSFGTGSQPIRHRIAVEYDSKHRPTQCVIDMLYNGQVIQTNRLAITSIRIGCAVPGDFTLEACDIAGVRTATPRFGIIAVLSIVLSIFAVTAVASLRRSFGATDSTNADT